MKVAKALRSFRRSDTKTWTKRGKIIQGDDEYIEQLVRGGMVQEVDASQAPDDDKAEPDAPDNKANPNSPENKAAPKAGGEKSSASPAAPASTRSKSNKSAAGAKAALKKA